jgi:hypothetical protein
MKFAFLKGRDTKNWLKKKLRLLSEEMNKTCLTLFLLRNKSK